MLPDHTDTYHHVYKIRFRSEYVRQLLWEENADRWESGGVEEEEEVVDWHCHPTNSRL